jgi:hypothetical protein
MFTVFVLEWQLKVAAMYSNVDAPKVAENSPCVMSGTKFSRSERLVGRKDLEKVKKEGRRRVLPELVLFFYPFRKVVESPSRLQLP